jgi:hypothetical protein
MAGVAAAAAAAAAAGPRVSGGGGGGRGRGGGGGGGGRKDMARRRQLTASVMGDRTTPASMKLRQLRMLFKKHSLSWGPVSSNCSPN